MSIFNTLSFVISHPLNRPRKIWALANFIKWHLANRLYPGSRIFDWVNNAKFIVRKGETGLTGNVYTGLHEFADMAFMLHYLRTNSLFVDVGANAGSYSILAGVSVGANVVAFEPVTSTFNRLIDNVRINRSEPNFICINKCVGSAVGSTLVSADSDTMNHVLAVGESKSKSVVVEVTTLDSELNGRNPDLIKIDVEGYEQPVLEGACITLKDKNLNCIIIELNGSGSRYGFSETDIVKNLSAYGFKSCSYDPFTRTITNLHGDVNFRGNTLFIRDLTLARSRVSAGMKYSINGSDL